MEKSLYTKALALLKELISTPSFSREEQDTARLIERWWDDNGITHHRIHNNLWATNLYFDPAKPTLLMNSHHDTVKPNNAYTRNPFEATVEEGRLYGLGSNDAGGALVALMASFLHYYKLPDLKYNLLMAATAEEEIAGAKGVSSILDQLPPLAFAVVGEPTQMHLAIAEKGLLVIDAYAGGVSGHAAHDNTDNAIYNAMEDINWINNYRFPNESKALGKVKMSVTQIEAGHQHNVVPATCHFVIDVRVCDAYTNREVFDIIDRNTKSKIVARSFRLNPSSIPETHPFVQAGVALGRKTYGSPTLSDQTHLPCPSLKIGPGKSTRSHSADEYIELRELEEGIELYINILKKIL